MSTDEIGVTEAQAEESAGQTQPASEPRISTKSIIKLVLAGVWMVIIALLLSAVADEFLQASGRSKLVDPAAFPINATLLGLLTILWFVVPIVYGYLAHRWMSKDALIIGPVSAAAFFSLVVLLQIDDLALPVADALPAFVVFLYVAVAALIGVIISMVMSSRRRKKQLAEG